MSFMLLLSLAVAMVAGEHDVISVFIPNADPQPLVASIIAQNSATTSFSINCPPGTDGASCGMGPGLFLTTAPTSVEYLIGGQSGDIYDHVICQMTGTTSGVCTATVTGSGANFPGTNTMTLNKDQITSLPVTITAGPKANSSAANTSAANTTATTSASTGTASTPLGGGGSSVDNAVSTSAQPTTSSPSNAGSTARVTGLPKLLIGVMALIAAV